MTTLAYAPDVGKEGWHNNGTGSITSLILDLLLSFDVLEDGVLNLLL